jgi:hypothetical protein
VRRHRSAYIWHTVSAGAAHEPDAVVTSFSGGDTSRSGMPAATLSVPARPASSGSGATMSAPTASSRPKSATSSSPGPAMTRSPGPATCSSRRTRLDALSRRLPVSAASSRRVHPSATDATRSCGSPDCRPPVPSACRDRPNSCRLGGVSATSIVVVSTYSTRWLIPRWTEVPRLLSAVAAQDCPRSSAITFQPRRARALASAAVDGCSASRPCGSPNDCHARPDSSRRHTSA